MDPIMRENQTNSADLYTCQANIMQMHRDGTSSRPP